MSFAAAKLVCLILGKAEVAGWSLTRALDGLTHISIPLAGTSLKYRCGARSYDVNAGERAAAGRPFETIQLKLQKGAALLRECILKDFHNGRDRELARPDSQPSLSKRR
jgi:hypothetical protein